MIEERDANDNRISLCNLIITSPLPQITNKHKNKEEKKTKKMVTKPSFVFGA